MALAQEDVSRLSQHGLHRHHSVGGETRTHEADVDGPSPQTGGRIDHAVVAHREIDLRAVLGDAPQCLADQRRVISPRRRYAAATLRATSNGSSYRSGSRSPSAN